MADQVFSRDEQVALLNRLLRLSSARKLNWRPTGGESSDRRTTLVNDEKFGFAVQSIDGDGERPYRLEVWRKNEKSEDLERFTTVSMVAIDQGGDSEINDLLVDLYNAAHQRSASEEEIVAEIFGMLDAIDEA